MSSGPEAPSTLDQPDQPDLPAPRWGLVDAIGSFLGFVVLSALVGGVLIGSGMERAGAAGLATLAGWVALAGWPLYVARRRGNGIVADLHFRFRPRDLAIGALATAVALVAATIFGVVYTNLVGEEPSSALGDAAELAADRWEVLVLIGLALGAPIVEEIHFRGMWWSVLRQKGIPGWGTLLLTSLLFAVVHLEPQRGVLLLALGLVIGYTRLLTDRLGAPISAHLLINAISTIGLFALL